MIFHNRTEAAILLAKKLEIYKNTNTVVLAIPRGGVPVAAIVARELNLPLDIILSKKIGHPHNPEFAIGSVTLAGASINGNVLDVSSDYIREEANKIFGALKAKYNLYTGGKKRLSLKGKNVIIIDDGIATGNTIMGTIEALKKESPAKLIVATPVAPLPVADKIREEGVDFVCIDAPEEFIAIGQFYLDFSQVSDEEVIDLLKKSSRRSVKESV